MKIGEIWRLKINLEKELLRCAKKCKMSAHAIVVEIINLQNDKVSFKDIEKCADGNSYKDVWDVENFISAYQKVYT